MVSAKAREGFPPQIKFMIGNEACERFSFYGMRSILVIFMVQALLMRESDSKAIYHYFVSACYLFPLLGGFLSDRFLGKFKTIFWLSLVYCAGHAALALWENQTGLYVGLGLIALGSGGIKPCVSAYVGDQFTEKNRHLVKSVYDIFYFSINFGSFFSTLLIPLTLVKFGPSVAFGIPGILMAIATLIFWLGRRYYVNVPPVAKTGEAGFMSVLGYSLINIRKKKKGESFLDVAKQKYSKDEVEATKAAWSIFKVFITVSAFWSLFDQHGSSWVLQAKQMDLNVLGMKFHAAQIAALNPIMVMVLIPIFAWGIYPGIERLGFKMTPLRKMSIGMVLAAVSFVAIGLIQVFLDRGHLVNVAWQFFPYLIITMAEVMISITGLEFAYTQAPVSMKSTIMSFWLLTVFIGNMLTGYVSKINVFEGAHFFFFFAIMMFVVSGIFIYAAAKYKVRDFLIRASEAKKLEATTSEA